MYAEGFAPSVKYRKDSFIQESLLCSAQSNPLTERKACPEPLRFHNSSSPPHGTSGAWSIPLTPVNVPRFSPYGGNGRRAASGTASLN
ncbi:hypothetical cytosolic protein [Syntrophus aciditrophicus SB]|uniref:Hypothetical cytosolic protein n=1 Tax=Syntrophus aciditrophicus (strain SB) TaxID=56780 RepID=Q2LPN2_SYNAS|nr:hypothetical cytosolic protein [Syntrophus aciditrophicus SB]